MAFSPKSQIYSTNNKEVLYLLDNTGLYDSATNKGGWDDGSGVSGNPRLQDCSDALMILTLPDGTDMQLSVKSSSLPFPNIYGIPYQITAESLGLESFKDGLYKAKVFYSGYFPTDPIQFWSSQSASTTYFTANVQCCVQKMFTKVDTTIELCKNTPLTQAMMANALLQSIWNAVGNYDRGIHGCGNYAGGDKILERLQYLCESTGCGCGCN